MIGAVRWLWCFALCACNQVFGLEHTELLDGGGAGEDTDGDGVEDLVDNCPAIANSTQLDVDQDMIGDACDPCSFGFDPALDRDKDTVNAAVDNCPGAADPGQTDSDGDTVGDICDPRPSSADTLRCFADFWINVPRAWPIADPWKWLGTASSAIIIHSPASAQPFWLGAEASGLPPAHGAVQVQMQVPGSPTTNVEVAKGIAIGADDGSAFAACELIRSFTSSGISLRVSESSGVLDEVNVSFTPTHVTLVYRDVPNGIDLQCIASDTTGMRVLALGATDHPVTRSKVFLTATNEGGQFYSLAIYDTP